jgi:hypothetical protein
MYPRACSAPSSTHATTFQNDVGTWTPSTSGSSGSRTGPENTLIFTLPLRAAFRIAFSSDSQIPLLKRSCWVAQFVM